MRQKYYTFVQRWGMMIAFLLLAGGGMYAVNEQAVSNATTLYHTQITGCERTNRLRAESNDRIDAHELDRNVLAEFLTSAAVARESAGTPTDIRAAEEYRQLRNSLKRVRFDSVPLVDCNKTIEKP